MSVLGRVWSRKLTPLDLGRRRLLRRSRLRKLTLMFLGPQEDFRWESAWRPEIIYTGLRTQQSAEMSALRIRVRVVFELAQGR